MTTNARVTRAWANGIPAASASLRTDGDRLFSYQLCIVHTDDEGRKVVRAYTGGSGHFRSQTTSCHVGLALRVADRAEVPTPKMTR